MRVKIHVQRVARAQTAWYSSKLVVVQGGNHFVWGEDKGKKQSCTKITHPQIELFEWVPGLARRAGVFEYLMQKRAIGLELL